MTTKQCQYSMSNNKPKNQHGPIKSLYLLAKTLSKIVYERLDSSVLGKVDLVLTKSIVMVDNAIVPIIQAKKKLVVAVGQMQNMNQIYKLYRRFLKIKEIVINKGIDMTKYFNHPQYFLDNLVQMSKNSKIPIFRSLSLCKQMYIDDTKVALQNIGTIMNITKQSLRIFFTYLPKEIDLQQIGNCFGVQVIESSEQGFEVVVNPEQLIQSLGKFMFLMSQVVKQAIKNIQNNESNSSKQLYSQTLRKIKQQSHLKKITHNLDKSQ